MDSHIMSAECTNRFWFRLHECCQRLEKIKKCAFIMEKGRWFTVQSQQSFFPDRQIDHLHYLRKGSSCNRNLDSKTFSGKMPMPFRLQWGFPSNDVFLQKIGFLMRECGHGWLIDPGIQTWDPAPLELWPEEGIRCVGFLWLTSLSKSYQSATLYLQYIVCLNVVSRHLAEAFHVGYEAHEKT